MLFWDGNDRRFRCAQTRYEGGSWRNHETWYSLEKTVEEDVHDIIDAGLGEVVENPKESDKDETMEEVKFKVAAHTTFFKVNYICNANNYLFY